MVNEMTEPCAELILSSTKLKYHYPILNFPNSKLIHTFIKLTF